VVVSDAEVLIGIGEVARRTGVGIPTLRAWERRYRLPTPRRTVGGHRLYGADEVEMVRWMAARVRTGMRAGDAVRLARARAGRTPQGETRDGAEDAATLRAAFVAACLNLDEDAATRALADAFARLDVDLACADVLQHGLRELGELWAQERATPHQEHLGSAVAMRQLSALSLALPAPTRPGSLMCGAAAGDEHELAPLLLSLFLRRAGWRVTYLSANVPVEGLAELADLHRPDLVILTAQSTAGLRGLAAAALELHPTRSHLAYGGEACNRLPGLRSALPALYLGDTIPEAVAVVEDALTVRAPSPWLPVPDSELHLFRRGRAAAEAAVQQALGDDAEAEAVRPLGDLIDVALMLGSEGVLPSSPDQLRDVAAPRLERDRVAALAAAYADAVAPLRIARRLRKLARA
jgi:methanogenic corrinoid protein MtbC1